MNVMRVCEFLILSGLCSMVFLVSCTKHTSGPKMINADGVNYLACDGAIWAINQGNVHDPITWTYDVIYEDASGARHQLRTIHTLKVTDLPADAPACRSKTQPSSSLAPH